MTIWTLRTEVEKKIDDRSLARPEDSLPLMQLPIVEQFLWCLSLCKSLVG